MFFLESFQNLAGFRLRKNQSLQEVEPASSAGSEGALVCPVSALVGRYDVTTRGFSGIAASGISIDSLRNTPRARGGVTRAYQAPTFPRLLAVAYCLLPMILPFSIM